MPQIAQQDYIKIDIQQPSDLTSSEMAEIRKHVENGTIWDVLFNIVSDGYTAKAVFVSETTVGICDFSTTAIIEMIFSE